MGAAVHFTNRLKQMNKSALPFAIRSTLNDVAFDVKKNTMPKQAGRTFKKRSPNFFKANSKVLMAQGKDIKTMQSATGFFENKLVNQASNYAVRDLEQQEHGGIIRKKAFIPLRSARVGRQGDGMVAAGFRMDKVKDEAFITSRRRSKSKNGKPIMVSKKQAFIRAAIMAKKLGKSFILGNANPNGSRTLSYLRDVRITKGRYTFAGGGSTQQVSKIDIERTPIYNVKKGRAVKVEQTQFMRRASEESTMKMNDYYVKRATTLFEKHFK